MVFPLRLVKRLEQTQPGQEPRTAGADRLTDVRGNCNGVPLGFTNG